MRVALSLIYDSTHYDIQPYPCTAISTKWSSKKWCNQL